MNYLERSMNFEREFANVSRVITELKTHNANECNKARRNGEEPTDIYNEWLRRLTTAKQALRDESDRLYLKHRQAHEITDSYGATCLANAILERAAYDYEMALCSDCEEAKYVMRDIEDFAVREGHLYTALDFPELLESIRDRHKRFCRKAHDEVLEIVLNTNKNRKHGLAEIKYNSHRCPLCGGGMYAKGKTKGYIKIACTNCNLSEVVELA